MEHLTASLRLIAALVLSAHHPRSAATHLTVAVDSAHREVILSAGPFIIPTQNTSDMSAMDMDQMMRNGETEAGRFTWPVSGLYRSVELEVLDSTGHPLPRRLLHHLNLINFDRRQLVYPLTERFIGFGQETEDVALPKSLGLPLDHGQRIGLYL
ncbi:MAG TPA: hypothetical protein VFU75_08070, partial [Gemmatimonadales bacterium]|nr:hypothetical protein [Gemmatimonadales bacterium]